MNVSLVLGDHGTLSFEGRPLSLVDLAVAFRSLPRGTSVSITLEGGGRSEERRSLFRQVAELIHESGLESLVLDASDLVGETKP